MAKTNSIIEKEKAAAELKCRGKTGLDSRRKEYKVPTVSSYIFGVSCSVLIISVLERV